MRNKLLLNGVVSIQLITQRSVGSLLSHRDEYTSKGVAPVPLTAVFEGVGFRKMSVKALFEADDTNGRQNLKKA